MYATQQANDLAALVVDRLGSTDTMKLQKLLYYCNAWSLVARGRPIYQDKTEAWKHGPVVPSIYAQHRTQASVSEWPSGDSNRLPQEDKSIANAVIDLYGARSGWALRNLTHAEDPWVNAWARCNQGEKLHEEITQDEIRTYYQSITS